MVVEDFADGVGGVVVHIWVEIVPVVVQVASSTPVARLKAGRALAGSSIHATIRSRDGSPGPAESKSITAARRPLRVMRFPGIRSACIQTSGPSQAGICTASLQMAMAVSVSISPRTFSIASTVNS